jgi:hypothetical protein
MDLSWMGQPLFGMLLLVMAERKRTPEALHQ